ncbi:MAG: hypothetical protein V4757_19145 [Pseudomonadota bacterium]
MNCSRLVLPALAALALAACDRPAVVVPPATTVVVPGPAVPGPPGPPGVPGATGEPGKPGESSTVIVMPPAPAASSSR